VSDVRWPARLQRLEDGPLTRLAPAGWEIWLDGGHNPAAGEILAETLAGWDRKPTVLICAMQENKDAAGFIRPLARAADRLIAIGLPGATQGHAPEDLAGTAIAAGLNADAMDTLDAALGSLSGVPGRALICGSLYLAGEVLHRNAV